MPEAVTAFAVTGAFRPWSWVKIGLLNAIWTGLGNDPVAWLLEITGLQLASGDLTADTDLGSAGVRKRHARLRPRHHPR